MNPMKLMQMKGLADKFKANHPKIPGFFNAVAGAAEEGSVLEMKLTGADGKTLCANIRITADDMALLREINEAVVK